jgi:hypothetical protein
MFCGEERTMRLLSCRQMLQGHSHCHAAASTSTPATIPKSPARPVAYRPGYSTTLRLRYKSLPPANTAHEQKYRGANTRGLRNCDAVMLGGTRSRAQMPAQTHLVDVDIGFGGSRSENRILPNHI